MLLVPPMIQLQASLFDATPAVNVKLARYARECYQSESIDSHDACNKFLARIIRNGHESVLEHEKITFRMTCDRGISHELVRHRIASYSQESMRYCDYKKKGNLEFIPPVGFANWSRRARTAWLSSNEKSEEAYFEMREAGVTPQDACDVLPRCFCTHVIATFNWRSLRNMLRLRSAVSAHPKYRQLAIPLLLTLKAYAGTEVLVHDIPYDDAFRSEDYARVIVTDDLFKGEIE